MGGGGGSWKVAFADFMTAMFALFLLMWLVNLKPEQKAGIESYFKTYTIFKNKAQGMKEGNNSVLPTKYTSGKSNVATDDTKKNKGEKSTTTGQSIEIQKQKLSEELKQIFEKKLQDKKNQVMIEETTKGIRIEMFDQKGKPMFEIGSTKPTDAAKEILKAISGAIRSTDYKLAIEGHTDAIPYPTKDYTNWELSTERALSARIEMQANGITLDRITSITGYAETKPLVKDDPRSLKNRRISILIDMSEKDIQSIASTVNDKGIIEIKTGDTKITGTISDKPITESHGGQTAEPDTSHETAPVSTHQAPAGH